LLEGPIFQPLRDPAYFARMTLDSTCGTVVWPNGADFAPEALHELEAERDATAIRGPAFARTAPPNERKTTPRE
jgi:hypothetical protein